MTIPTIIPRVALMAIMRILMANRAATLMMELLEIPRAEVCGTFLWRSRLKAKLYAAVQLCSESA
jgi:hypothetical protein